MPKDKRQLIQVTGHSLERESTRILWDAGTKDLLPFTDLRLLNSLGRLVRLSSPKNIPPTIWNPPCLLRLCAEILASWERTKKSQQLHNSVQGRCCKLNYTGKACPKLRSAPQEQPKLKQLLHCHSYSFKVRFSREICWYFLMLKHQDINQQEDSESSCEWTWEVAKEKYWATSLPLSCDTHCAGSSCCHCNSYPSSSPIPSFHKDSGVKQRLQQKTFTSN